MTSTTRTAGAATPGAGGAVRAVAPKRDVTCYAVAVTAVVVAVLLKLMVAPWIDEESPFLFFFAAVMVGAWRGGAGPGLVATTLAAVAAGFFFMAPAYSFEGFSRGQAVQLTQFVVEGTVISLLGGALHHARRRAEEMASREQAAHDEAEAARARLDAAYAKERRITETLQRSLLLKVPPGRFDGMEVAPLYEAALDEAEVGGDFYDAFCLPGGQVALAVGDVSGKGLGAAARTAEAKFALRALLHEDPAPERALGRLNRFLCDQRRGLEGVPDDEDADARFITLALAVVESATGEVHIAAAGSEPPLVVRAGARSGADTIVEAQGLPLGVDEEAGYTAVRRLLAPGDTLLLVTDGITEARAPKTEGVPAFLEYEGFAALAGEACRRGEPAGRTGQRILEGAKRFAGGSLRDDACLLLARRT